MIENIE